MRLATITNWAYGATVLLTLSSGATMLMASDALEDERAAVALRHRLDQATGQLGEDVFRLTGQARQYVVDGDPAHLVVYRREAAALEAVEQRIAAIGDAGADQAELDALAGAIRWAETLHDEQEAAIAAYRRGDAASARQIMFGAEYERELDRVSNLLERFHDRLDRRTEAEIAEATGIARLWRTVSEIMLGITGLLFLCVLYFVLRQRILKPVVRLSDVVSRLAAQDYAVEPPDIDQVDEIGDMAQAIRIFRENGIERQRLEQERDADQAMRDMLSRMTQRMQGCDTVDGLAAVVGRFVPEIAPALAGRLYLLDDDRNALVEICSWRDPVHSRAEFAPTACWALRRGLPHRPAGNAIDVPCDHLDAAPGESADTVCLPLSAQQEMIGLLYFEAREGSTVDTSDVYFAMLTENIGLALANLRLRDALRDMAMADPLTGLANRRQLEAVLASLAGAESAANPVSALMLDVDHFKRFNDEFGHEAGDEVLRAVGAALSDATRGGGLAFRYGGEEFVVLMPGLDCDRAANRANEIRSRVAALDVRLDGRALGPVTVSIGVAAAPDHGPVEGLVQTADAALLRAKGAGRDRVVAARARGAAYSSV